MTERRDRAFQVVRDFEATVAEYTGAPYVVAVDSCTNAILLSLRWWREQPSRIAATDGRLYIPQRTYVGVAQSILNIGYRIGWRDKTWTGAYPITPTPVWDSAKRFTGGMYLHGTLTCVSFQAGKILPIGRGGAILTDSRDAAEWLRRARFDGRSEGADPKITTPGYHCYMDPPSAARGLWLMSWIQKDNPDLPCDEYEDLSQMEAFR